MKEFLETISDELRRMSGEGIESIPLDDDALRILRRMEADELAAEMRSELTDAGEEPEAVKFATGDDLKIETHKKETIPQQIRIVQTPTAERKIPAPTPFKLPDGTREQKWLALRDIVLSDPVCNAHIKPQKKGVFGIGNLETKIFFCGEAPGADEEIQGEPYVGREGQLLTNIISAMGLRREDGLFGEDPNRKMGEIRGKWNKFGDADLMITYHPSFLLQYGNNNKMKRLVWEDMMAVMERTEIPISEKQRNYFL